MSKTLELVKVTREQAEHWLGATTHQRSMSKRYIEFLKTDMQSGNWQPHLAPPIIIDEADGAIIDGQHRLRAFLETKKETLETYLTEAPRKAIQVVDTGRPRSLPDTLEIRGHEYTRYKSAWLNRSLNWVTGHKAGALVNRTTQVAIVEASPYADKAAEMAFSLHRLGGRKVYRIPTGTVAALWDMQQYGVGGEWVEEFCRRIQTSEDLTPMLARVQSKLVEIVNPKTKNTVNPDGQSYLVARVFHAWVNDEDISRFYARRVAIRELPGYKEWSEANFGSFIEL